MSAITRIDLPSVWHGAAMARHGRRPSPAPAARPVRFFTKHETRITRHEIRNTAFIAVSARGVAPPETSVRPTAPAGKSLFSCSPLFSKKILSGTSVPAPSTPATRPVRFSRNTKHEARNTAFMLFMNHETRNRALDEARGASQRKFRGFHETRNTKHETRLFFETRPFCRVGRPLMREGGRPAGFKGGCTKRCVNEWKEVYLNHETGITTFTESRLGSRPGISHNIPQCVGKIRISPCCQSSASAHCGNRDIGLTCLSHHVARRSG